MKTVIKVLTVVAVLALALVGQGNAAYSLYEACEDED